jgi:hypothetical protein
MAGKGFVVDITPAEFDKIYEATAAWDKVADESITSIHSYLQSLRTSGDVEGGKGDAVLNYIKAESQLLQEVRGIKRKIKSEISKRAEAARATVAGTSAIEDKAEKVKGGVDRLRG